MFLLVIVFITAVENKQKGKRHFLLDNSFSFLFLLVRKNSHLFSYFKSIQ